MLRRSVKAKSRIRDNSTTRRFLRARLFPVIMEAFYKDLHGFQNPFLPPERLSCLLLQFFTNRPEASLFLYAQWI